MPAAVGRLKRRPDFLRVAASRRKCVMPGLILQAAEMPPGTLSHDIRLGFTASRKVGNAVERNRARRRLKAAAAKVMPGQALTVHDYVLVARVATLSRAWQGLIDDLEAALKRIKAWRGGALPTNTGQELR